MKYKVGDKVRIKSLDWYYENKDKRGFICFVHANFIPEMSRYCGEILTINQVVKEHGQYRMSECGFAWTDEMIEGCVESIEDRLKELRKMCTISLTDSNYTDKVEVLLNDYEYIEENGKAFFVKKKKEYPKTYEECCKVLGVDPDNYITIRNVHCYDGEEEMVKYENDLLNKFGFLWKLIICRNAYWEIAREEIGLDKPWEPDYNNEKQLKYGLYELLKYPLIHPSQFVFPTEEMKDKFYENFKDYFNKCRDR